ncbi:MAG: glucosaminidase domain-containing protein [Clostridia bacterium]|nr:glucosaminidase domain-containing protein [Clostridia bacterium]
MKSFWKIAWIPLLGLALILVTVITMLSVWQPPEDEDGDFYTGMQIFYLDSSTEDNDERLQNSYVNNSGTNFFVQGDQLKNQIYIEENTTTPYRVTFYDRYRQKQQLTATMDLPMAKRVHLIQDVEETEDGSTATGVTYKAGQELIYREIEKIDGKYYYRLDDDRYISAVKAVRICQRNAFEGTLSHPFAVDADHEQYLSFTGPGDYVYITFTTDNEFISLFLSGLPKGSSWEMYDHTYHKVSTRYAGERETEEIYYRAASAGRFLLKINAADEGQVKMGFHRDQNEWQKNMTSAGLDDEYSGVFDYYGDEDFFILGKDVKDDLEALALELSGVDAALQIMAYDENKNLIGRYTSKKGVSEEIVFYGLQDVYALALRTVDGSVRDARYNLRFYYMGVKLHGLETFGFKLASTVEEGENYYTAVCNGLTGKRITDVQTARKSKITMTLTTAAGNTYSFKEGEDMPLRPGKNTVKIHIENASEDRTLTLCITDRGSYQLGYAFILDNSTPLYSQPLTSSDVLGYLSSGTKVMLTGGKQNNMIGIELTDGSGRSGWVQQHRIFDDYEKCAMPSSYASAINKLKKAHPNWKFTFVKAGKSLDKAVADERKQNPIITTSTRWRTPTESELYYYINPANFLNEQDIFMFEKQTYHEGTYSAEGLAAVWSQREGALASENYYVQCFLEAGKVAGLSPYFIGARASLESGNGTSNLAKGLASGYEGYYNFYGIDAVDANPKKGAIYAKEQGWSTQRIAIVEGAVWIKSQYISVLQYTPYFIKYCFVPGRNWHQYMTDVAAPVQDAGQCYKAHVAGGTLDSEIEFVIPVFD